MNPEQDSGSLADRAAAWVPPWERPADREQPADAEHARRAKHARTSRPDDGLDDAAALDREIDADIVREAGLPGPGTVESRRRAPTIGTAETADVERGRRAEADAESSRRGRPSTPSRRGRAARRGRRAAGRR